VSFQLRLDREGMRELLKSHGVQREMNRRGDKIADRARQIAPYDSDDDYHYRDHIVVQENQTPNRARAEVVAEAPYAIFVESRHRTLGRAIDAARGD
jgi:hypothetical protein